jgi:2,4-dienoyl-CoA reductase-like NADH-dependent reductase (Old Yellow Enzyme family)
VSIIDTAYPRCWSRQQIAVWFVWLRVVHAETQAAWLANMFTEAQTLMNSVQKLSHVRPVAHPLVAPPVPVEPPAPVAPPVPYSVDSSSFPQPTPSEKAAAIPKITKIVERFMHTALSSGVRRVNRPGEKRFA